MTDESNARSVLRAILLEDAQMQVLGSGFASVAWAVRAGERELVLRVATSLDGGRTYEMEHALMTMLGNVGANVSPPVIGSWEVPGWSGPAFSVTGRVPGDHLAPTAHVRAAPELARFIRSMWSLRLDGHGPLEIVDGGIVRGGSADRASGLRAWAEHPLWPLDRAGLDAHPALAPGSALSVRLSRRAAEVRAALLAGPSVALHSDLHEENLLELDGVLHVLDFGEALVGPAAWEFAALGYFLGWPLADATLDAVTLADPDTGAAARLRADASAMALCFGLFRWRQDRELGLDEDEYDSGFLEETLLRMESRGDTSRG